MIYGSQYRHITLSARTTDGVPFLLAAGQHEPDFPYAGAVFDSVLLMLGDRRLQRSALQLAGLELPMLVPDEERELALALELRTAGTGPDSPPPDRALTMVEASLQLRFGSPHVQVLGLQRSLGFSLGVVPGMRYAAMIVDANPRTRPWLRIDGTEYRLEPATLVGQIEWGDLVSWSARTLQFGYRYRCAVEPAGELVRVDLRAHSLHADSFATRLADLVIDRTTNFSLIGARHRSAPAPAPEPTPPGAELTLVSRERLVHAPLRLGPADVDRALCRFRDSAGRDFVGFEETARPASGEGYPLPEG